MGVFTVRGGGRVWGHCVVFMCVYTVHGGDHARVSHEGGAGESGFCYEAGASVEVAPEDSLLTSPLITAAPAKPEALPAVPHEDGRLTRERDESAQRDVEEHEVEEEEE